MYDGIGVVTGPGSFTGVRIGVAAAQGLSASAGAPLIGVSTMALEAKAASSVVGDGFYLVCHPAKSGEVYMGAYQCEAGKPRLVCEEFLLTLVAQDLSIPSIIKNKEWIINNPEIFTKNISLKKEFIKINSNFNYDRINSLFSNLSSLSFLELMTLKKNLQKLQLYTLDLLLLWKY